MQNNTETKLFPIFSPRSGNIDKPRVGYMNKSGTVVIPPLFYFGLEFREGAAPVLKGKKWRFINSSGEKAFDREFADAEIFSGGRACVRVAPRKYGYIDSTGDMIVDGKYSQGDRYCEDRALVYVGKLAGFIDKKGFEIVKPRFTSAGRFSEGMAHVQQDGKWGYVDKAGEISIPIAIEALWASPFKNGFAPLRVGTSSNVLCGFIDPTGQIVISPRFLFTYGFSESLAAVEAQEGWGYIGTTGDWAIKPKFSRAYPFSEGLAAIDISNNPKSPEIGYINKSGEVVIQPRFGFGGVFHDGICWVEENECCGYIGPSGEYIWQCPRVLTNMSLRL